MDETQPNLSYEARVVKRIYIFVKPIIRRKVSFFSKLKMFYFKDSFYQLLGELSIRLIGSTELTNAVRENL